MDATEIKNNKVSFNVVPITDNDKETLKNFLRQYFFRDEPLSASLNLIEEEESVIQFENFCIDLLQFGVSFMAVSAETGDIIGAVLNSTVCREKAERDIDFFGQYPNIERLMKLEIITVNEAYRGQGICKALVKKSKELALKLGYQMISVECSSKFTKMAVERFGFQCIYSISYSDYVNKQGEVVFKTQPPHKYFKVHALLL
ncbi:dopamine N-acetyltransferase-like isoform X2 [Rhopalosiphum maidis]|uniref:dopamine N-acetyltransferase-like isoform X2 n=1 Tax=Rhopalosiphum maidis TaxID=43146 RepID=UPI000EFE2299|nr:dopamine N-acetyltransferase-like isoform X2 [Rhopalosiphum maidis]